MTAHAPIRHHYQPVFQLNAWAVDGRVVRYYRPHDKVVASPIAPKNTGYDDYLYTLTDVSPEHQHFLETKFFAPVDSEAAVVCRLLLNGGLNGLSNEQRCHFARFLLSTQLRNPFALGEVQRLAAQNVRANLDCEDAEYDAVRKPGEPNTIYGWTAKHMPQILANAHKHMLPGLIDHEELGQYLVNMHWATHDLSSAKHFLLTGDRPLISTHGWKDSRAVLMFPLSPECLFTATNSVACTQRTLVIDRSKFVRYVNGQTASCAVNFVIGNDSSHLAFVEKRLRRLDEEPIPGPVGKGRPLCPP